MILARLFGYLALILATAFAALGVIFLLDLTLPVAVTAFAGVQALWWLAAAITLIIRSWKIPNSVGKKDFAVSEQTVGLQSLRHKARATTKVRSSD